MTDHESQAPGTEEEFQPRGTIVITVAYILIFASAWGLVYFTDLLARR